VAEGVAGAAAEDPAAGPAGVDVVAAGAAGADVVGAAVAFLCPKIADTMLPKMLIFYSLRWGTPPRSR